MRITRVCISLIYSCLPAISAGPLKSVQFASLRLRSLLPLLSHYLIKSEFDCLTSLFIITTNLLEQLLSSFAYEDDVRVTYDDALQ